MKFIRQAIATACVLGPMLNNAMAVEGGAPITAVGVQTFGAGMLPPPTEGGTIGLRAANYRASKVRTDTGELAPIDPRLEVTSASVAYIHMTELELGDARYGWGGVLPVLRGALDITVPTPGGPLPLSGLNQAQGDLQLFPLIMQWTPSPGVYSNFQLQVRLPTGSYDKNRLINAGSNHWTVTPAFAYTYIDAGGLEFSTNVQLNFHSRNKATDYRSGIEFQQEFAVGMHTGPWTWGLGGYLYQQISDDQGPSVVNGNRSRVRALGPAVQFFELGSGWPPMWAHLYREFGARNRSEGTQLAVRASWSF